MYAKIHANLDRQVKGLELLHSLLEEEFARLLERDVEEISALEFSIHELMRQLLVERMEIKTFMNGIRVSEYAEMLPEEDGATIQGLVEELLEGEQVCSRQAGLNSTLAFGLLDQGQELLDFLYSAAVPEQLDTYGSKGGIQANKPGAALISGRL
jgi:flagellar biosynthesis/type III secretory pathway chaperone